MGLLGKIFGTEDPVRIAHPIVAKINALEKEFEKLTREELIGKTRHWQQQIRDLSRPAGTLSSSAGRGESC